ncbi:hypothetical protein GCM10007216_03860 [Thalassobacillus devorans]|uniref:DNA phosphorothioation-associated protein 4 n=1 Tax=Thalassobacillus devorans TaxID=279813 RepID=A0ABQ1NGP8_9BACI|nr:DNA phosphorothioation-associated protein 4 [Thalassobacillus devorans]NIK27294.1 dnd system-associated protein 4 [Thalassobacillus devorans]GGC76530.1 hypothetical protein GCM10007216_03860 [Thalassobacillus devorans]
MFNRRIRRPKEQEHIYTKLTDKNEFGIFESYKDLFMLSLVVGYLEDKRHPFNETLEQLHWQVFKERTDEPIINMIAFLETQNFMLLSSPTEEHFDEKITIAEEYAAGGAEKVYNLVMEDEKNALQKIIDYLQEFEEIQDEQQLKKKRLKENLNL